MPKYSKEMEEKIIAALEQGKINSVISRELSIDRGALPSRRKAWEKRKQKQETPETEPDKTIQQEQNIDPQENTQVLNNHQVTLSQISLLKKRMGNIEKKQLRQVKDFNAVIYKKLKQLEKSQGGSNPVLLDKRISELEKSQRGAKPYLLKRRISKLEDSQVGSNPSLLESRISKLEEMKRELLESVNSRLREDDVCKHIGRNGYCHYWQYPYDDVNKVEFLQPGGKLEYKGNISYLVNVKKHTFICSACQAYEKRS